MPVPIRIQNLIHPVFIVREGPQTPLYRIKTEIRAVFRTDDQDIVKGAQAAFAHPGDWVAAGLELAHHIISIHTAVKL